MASTVVHITFEEIYDQEATEPDLQREVSNCPLESTLDLLGRLSALLRFSQNDYRTPEFQLAFVEQLNVSARNDRIVGLIKQGRLLIYPEQLAILIKYLVRYSAAPSRPPDFGTLFARALLLVSSLRPTRLRNAETARPADFVRIEIAGMFGFEDPYINKLLVYASFFKWASTPTARSHPAFCDVNADVQSLLGMSWLDFMAAGYGEILRFKQVNSFEALSRYSYVLPPKYVDSYSDSRIIGHWLDLNTIELNELKRYLDQPMSDLHIGATLFPLKQRPFIRLTSGNLCCPYEQFLENASTSGLYYRLADAYYREDPKKSRLLRTFFGQFLEQYALSLFSRVAKIRGYTVEGDKTYLVGRDEHHGADVVVFHGSDAVFMEVTSTRFREIESLIELRDEFIEEDIDRLIDKIDELNEDICDFRHGDLEYDAIDPKSIRRIFPIVVTSFSVPHWVGIISRIRAAIEDNGWLRDTEPLEIVEVQALDLLEGDISTTLSLFDLLSTKQDKTKNAPLSLMNFVALRGGEVGLNEPTAKPPSLIEIEDELRSRYNSWGGPQIVPP